MKKKSTLGQGIKFPPLKSSIQTTAYHFYLKIYLETGAPLLAELKEAVILLFNI